MSIGNQMFGTTNYPTPVPSNQQVVIPQITFPQIQPTSVQPSYPIQGPQLNKVYGMDGAKAFPTIANARYALFDADDDVMYIKTTDQNNYPSIQRYRFYEEEEPKPAPPPEYVTKEDYDKLLSDFNSFKEEMLNAKQSISKRTAQSAAKSE